MGATIPVWIKKTPAQPHALLPKQHSVPKLCLAVTDKAFPLFSGYAPSWLYRVQSLQFFTPFCDVLFSLGSVVKGKYPLLPFPFLPFGLTASCPRTLLSGSALGWGCSGRSLPCSSLLRMHFVLPFLTFLIDSYFMVLFHDSVYAAFPY